MASFIIRTVLQSYFTDWLWMLQQNLREILLVVNLLLALLIFVVSVKKWKTRRSMSCNLLFVGVVPSHFIVNVCQGYFLFLNVFIAYIFFWLCPSHTLNDSNYPFLEGLFSSWFYQRDWFWWHWGWRYYNKGLGRTFTEQSHSYLLLVSFISICMFLYSNFFLVNLM